MRPFGAALLAAAGLWCGLRSVSQLRRQEALDRELCLLLTRLRWELERFRTPLPELFTALSAELTGPTGTLCRSLGEGLASGRELPPLWREGIGAFPAPEREILSALGPVLGRYGGAEQTDALASALDAMERLRMERRASLPERSRVRLGLWAGAGLLLAVIFY